jgi:hypothetical protein
VDPVPDPLQLRKFGSAGNRRQDLWVSSQELQTIEVVKRTSLVILINSGTKEVGWAKDWRTVDSGFDSRERQQFASSTQRPEIGTEVHPPDPLHNGYL